jgi:hypothetical protein
MKSETPMSREIECPSCGLRIPLENSPASTDPSELPVVADVAVTVETVIPSTVCLDEDCRRQIDEAGLSSTGHPGPVESFGVFVAGDGPGSSSGSRADVLLDGGSHSSDNGHSVSDPDLHPASIAQAPPAPDLDLGSGSSDALMPAEPDPVLASLQTPDSHTSAPGDVFLSQFSPAEAPSESRSAPDVPSIALGASAPAPPEPTSSQSGTDDEEYEEQGRSLGSILLASYASALTLAFLWLLWTGRISQSPSGPPSPSPDSLEAVESGAFLRNLPKLPIDKRTPVGKSLRIGDLEITPLAVETRRETLVSLDGQKSKTDPGTLTLRLRLRNLSDDQTFAPIEPRFIRVPDRGLPETVLVTDDEPIFPYPLAFQSERAIQGQNFDPLAPGAERELSIVSAPDAQDKLSPSMTWRIRLRTSPGQTDTIGIEFQKGDVRP